MSFGRKAWSGIVPSVLSRCASQTLAISPWHFHKSAAPPHRLSRSLSYCTKGKKNTADGRGHAETTLRRAYLSHPSMFVEADFPPFQADRSHFWCSEVHRSSHFPTREATLPGAWSIGCYMGREYTSGGDVKNEFCFTPHLGVSRHAIHARCGRAQRVDELLGDPLRFPKDQRLRLLGVDLRIVSRFDFRDYRLLQEVAHFSSRSEPNCGLVRNARRDDALGTVKSW